jgi:hypothetical protein
MQYPTKETHPRLFGDTTRKNLVGWIQWMHETNYLVPREDETFRHAVIGLSISAVCSYLRNPRSMARRQMPMAMDFYLLEEEEQEEIIKEVMDLQNPS